jgi:hypothetical protein
VTLAAIAKTFFVAFIIHRAVIATIVIIALSQHGESSFIVKTGRAYNRVVARAENPLQNEKVFLGPARFF